MRKIRAKIMTIVLILAFQLIFFGCTSASIKVGIISNSNSGSITNAETDKKAQDLSKDKSKLLEDIASMENKLAGSSDANFINEVLNDYYNKNKTVISCIYFGKETGEFFLCPKQELPQNYDARIRPWYEGAIINTTYSTTFPDYMNGKNIITVAKVISKDSKNIGVMSIDKFIEE